jgi:selenocysteine-specific elongation factor
MIKDDEIAQEGDTVRLAAHEVSLETDQAEVKENILNAYVEGKLTPPYFKDLSKTLNIDPARAKDVLMILVGEGNIVKIKADLYFHAGAVSELKEKVVAFLTDHGEMSTPQFKDIAGVSRKYLIPLMEHLDSRNITIRVGDIRKLRSR